MAGDHARATAALISIWALAAVVSPMAQPTGRMPIGIFSDLEPGGLPDGWEPWRFPSVEADTRYTLIEEDGVVVLEADSRVSASALLTRVRIDTSRYPYLTWVWKTDAACFVGDWQLADRDDYPLRLFVIFRPRGGLFSLLRRLGPGFRGDAILYVPDSSNLDANRASHLDRRIQVVPLARPAGGTAGWRRQVRDVRADYRALFGREPRDVAGVAVMTDTDNSRTECVSHFGDIYFTEERP